jgi:hypothetical protein
VPVLTAKLIVVLVVHAMLMINQDTKDNALDALFAELDQSVAYAKAAEQ